MEAVRQGAGGDKTRLMKVVRACKARDGISINQLYNAGEEGLRCVGVQQVGGLTICC